MDQAALTSFATFEEFWPFYVGQHQRSGTRALHFVGTTLGLLCLARAVSLDEPAFFLWGLLFSYGFAWLGHAAIEKNRPATFSHPIWSLMGDLRMYERMWRGMMTAEAERIQKQEPRDGRGSRDSVGNPTYA